MVDLFSPSSVYAVDHHCLGGRLLLAGALAQAHHAPTCMTAELHKVHRGGHLAARKGSAAQVLGEACWPLTGITKWHGRKCAPVRSTMSLGVSL